MNCFNCGKQVINGSSFCTNCGANVSTAVSAASAAQVPIPSADTAEIEKKISMYAAFAPVSIVVGSIISVIINIIFPLISEAIGAISIVFLGSLLSSICVIAAYVIIYYLFTNDNRAKMPLVLCIIAPGTLAVINNIVGGFFGFLAALLCHDLELFGYNYSTAQGIFSGIGGVLSIIISAVLSYLVAKIIFKKVLLQ